MALFLFALLRGCAFLSDQKGTKESPGAGSEECQHSSRLPPDPHYGRRFPDSHSSHPARAVQPIAPASPPLPLAGQFAESPASWTEKARLVPPAVGAGAQLAGGETPPLRKGRILRCRGGLWPPAVNFPAKQHGKSQADPVGVPGPNLRRARAQWPGRRGQTPLKFCPPEGTFLPKGPHQKRRFGSFAAVGKGTRRRGGGISPLLQAVGFLRADGIRPYKNGGNNKKRGSDRTATPTVCVQNGRRGETKFRGKFFCLLFFQEK